MIPWKTLSRRTVLHTGKFLTVEMHAVQLPDGRTIPDWPWLITPDYVIVVAQTVDGLFLLFRQTKYAAAGTTLAPVGGYLERGEDPQAAAQRELLEETGYTATEWIPLGAYACDANRGAGQAHLFLARQCAWSAKPQADDLEEQHLLRLTRAELQTALAEQQFKVLPWVAAVALGLSRIDTLNAAPGL